MSLATADLLKGHLHVVPASVGDLKYIGPIWIRDLVIGAVVDEHLLAEQSLLITNDTGSNIAINFYLLLTVLKNIHLNAILKTELIEASFRNDLALEPIQKQTLLFIFL